MAKTLVMPKFGLTMKEGFITKWLKNEGDLIEKGDAVLEIETEKLTNVLESPFEGTLLKISAPAGDAYPIASVLAYIGEHGEDISALLTGDFIATPIKPCANKHSSQSAAPGRADPGGRVKASPKARALAKTLDVDYRQLTGSGPNGRIIAQDVADAASGLRADASNSAVEAFTNRHARGAGIPYSGMRKAIGSSMSASWSNAPMVTHHTRLDLHELLLLREQLNSGSSEGEAKIGVLDMLSKIILRTLTDFPIVNATLHGDEILVHDTVNLGIATAVEGGLLVPVVRAAERLSLFELSNEIKTLTAKARNGRLTQLEMSGGSVTITNIGGIGSVDFFTPIINPPEAAIFGIGRTEETPVVRNGEIVVRPLCGFSFTFDHRIIDGAPAAEFLAAMQQYLTRPARAIFEV
jgi:pyruvate dehydrogenase E2 component (dihydrolipoamide acetyltransferase)